MTNIVPFPKRPGATRAEDGNLAAAPYEFTPDELTQLCRWYSAMRYAFPGMQAVMATCHVDRVSAIGLYHQAGAARPNCLLSKHQREGGISLFWATANDPPRIIGSLAELTDAQIVAIAPPRNEKRWLDAVGWMKIFAERTIAGVRSPLGLAPHSA
jgi:hypothetical protein